MYSFFLGTTHHLEAEIFFYWSSWMAVYSGFKVLHNVSCPPDVLEGCNTKPANNPGGLGVGGVVLPYISYWA